MADDPNLSPKDPEGNGKPSPKGDEGGAPKGDEGNGKKKDGDVDYKKRYDDLRPDYDKKSTRLSKIANMAERYGYDPDNPEDVDKFMSDLDYSYQQLSGGDKGGKPDGAKPPEKPPDKTPDPSTDLKKSLAISTKFSFDAKKDSQFEAFLRKNPGFDESLRPELDKEIDGLMDENPKVFQKGNWYGIAERSKMLGDDGYITKIKQSAIKEEEERVKKLGDLDSETGGVKASGASKTLEENLKKRLG